jgi:phosphoribosyl 1,2-cyclic phosphodiesterase
VKLRFWGVRGSIPVPGVSTGGYGGNTSCVEVQADGEPVLVMDCGTGARRLGVDVLGRPERELHVLFTHFHMDHLFGFPFFAPIFAPSFKISVSAPGFSPEGTRERIAHYLNGVYHPLRIPEVAARLEFDHLRPGKPFERANYAITGLQLNHPGGSCGYVVEHGGRKVAYLTDTSPMSRPGEHLAGGGKPNSREAAVCRALKDADAVVFDTMFTQGEYLEKMTWGHSYPEYAVNLCKAADVKTLWLFHHAPDASDADLDQLAERWSRGVEGMNVRVAKEELAVDLEG